MSQLQTQVLPKLEHLNKGLNIWHPATWEDYLTYRDDPSIEKIKLFFNQGYLFIEMGGEGINHAKFNELLTMILFSWFAEHPEQDFALFGGCLMEKPKTKAAAPDIVLYLREDYPRWQPEDSRYIDLRKHPIPDLVGEVGDTTLATDLDEKKHLYAELEVPEYWVIDVQAKRLLAFILQENGIYKETDTSLAIKGLSINVIEQTLKRLDQETNGRAALWFAKQIKNSEQ
ncbi:MAG: Uma2 family endonuclease [Microcystaceae cyanobacterium]